MGSGRRLRGNDFIALSLSCNLILRGFSGLEQLEARVGVLPVELLQEAHGIDALEVALRGRPLLSIRRFNCNFIISEMMGSILVSKF